MIKTITIILTLIFFSNSLSISCTNVRCASVAQCPLGFEKVTKGCCSVCEIKKQVCPLGCSSYFDGCNACTCSNGKFLGCTKKACLTKGEPKCLKRDCSLVRCQQVLCPQGTKSVVQDGECCPKCVPEVITNACPLGCASYFDGCNTCSCKNGQISACTQRACKGVRQPEKCLRRDCSLVKCRQVLCPQGTKIVVQDGECCPKCIPEVKAEENTEENIEENVCPLGCSLYSFGCQECQCQNGKIVTCFKKKCIAPTEPKCLKRDCSTVRCAVKDCGVGFKPVLKDGECCQYDCVRDDSVCPTGCVKYYDGCNSCGCVNGKKTACTKRACLTKSKAFCVVFDEEFLSSE